MSTNPGAIVCSGKFSSFAVAVAMISSRRPIDVMTPSSTTTAASRISWVGVKARAARMIWRGMVFGKTLRLPLLGRDCFYKFLDMRHEHVEQLRFGRGRFFQHIQLRVAPTSRCSAIVVIECFDTDGGDHLQILR